jgi:hypothetical protein
MTERDWEASAKARLERLVAETVSRVRNTADRIEREAQQNISSASETERDMEYQSYPCVAARIAHELNTLLFNVPIESMIDAATDAEIARTEKAKATKP